MFGLRLRPEVRAVNPAPGEEDTAASAEDDSLLPFLSAASIQGRVALGPDAGSPVLASWAWFSRFHRPPGLWGSSAWTAYPWRPSPRELAQASLPRLREFVLVAISPDPFRDRGSARSIPLRTSVPL
jgi:hypothetical protein